MTAANSRPVQGVSVVNEENWVLGSLDLGRYQRAVLGIRSTDRDRQVLPLGSDQSRCEEVRTVMGDGLEAVCRPPVEG